MGSLITFPNKAKSTKLDTTIKENYQDLVSSLQSNSANNYTIKEAEELADTILSIDGYLDIQAPPPIINIAQDFGFFVVSQPITKSNISGNIYIGGTTAQCYPNSNNVIIVSDEEEYFHQRFIIAHELGHYLMNYLNNPEYTNNPGKLFSKPYYSNKQNDLQADKFAAELLMPQHQFTTQYLFAIEESYDRRYAISYLSSFFKVTKSRVERRILEIMNSVIIKSGRR